MKRPTGFPYPDKYYNPQGPRGEPLECGGFWI